MLRANPGLAPHPAQETVGAARRGRDQKACFAADMILNVEGLH